jgi:hypothetical protein
VLGKVQAVLTETMHAVIVLQIASGLQNAEHYCNALHKTQWKTDIVDTTQKALEILIAGGN